MRKRRLVYANFNPNKEKKNEYDQRKYYSVFYQYRLVPRWLSVWGLVGITLTIISCLLVMFHLLPPAGIIQVILSLPIMVQEMVLAVWLIAKGVNPSAVASLSTKTAPNKLLSAV